MSCCNWFKKVYAYTLSPLVAPWFTSPTGSVHDWVKNSIEKTANALGFEDEELLVVDVKQVKLFPNKWVNPLNRVILKSVTTGAPLCENVAMWSAFGTHSNIDGYYNYGRTHYYNSLPLTEIRTTVYDATNTKQIIDNELGVDSVIQSTAVGPMNRELWCKYKLQENGEYNAFTDIVSYSGSNWIIDFIENIGSPITYSIHLVDPNDENNKIEMANTINTFPLSTYYIVYWNTNNDPVTDKHIWVYDESTATYPDLNIEINNRENADIMPILPIRISGRNINDKQNANYNASEHRTTKKMLTYLGIDLNQLLEGILEQITSPEPPEDQQTINDNLDGFKSIFIYFAISITPETQVEKKALFETIKFLYGDGTGMEESDVKMTLFREGLFNQGISYNTIVEGIDRVGVGSAGLKRGEYSCSIEQTMSDDPVDLRVIFQKEDNLYDRYFVKNISSITMIKDGDIVEVVASRPDKMINGELAKDITIPLAYNTLRSLTPIKRSELMNASIVLSIYSSRLEVLRYYQTDRFLGFLRIVVYVYVITTTIATLGSGAEVSTVIGDMLLDYAVMKVASEAMKYVINNSDSALARNIATVLYVGISTYSTSKDGGSGLADILVKSVTYVAEAQTAISNTEINKLLAEQESYVSEYNERMKEIRKIKENIDERESPDDFFNRTLNQQPIKNDVIANMLDITTIGD
jgi:hypothetical protein